MDAKLISNESSISGINNDGIKVISALKSIINTTNAADIVEIGNLLKSKPDAIKKALKYKHLL